MKPALRRGALVLIVLLLGSFLLFSSLVRQAAVEGLGLCAKVLVPSLFPFCVLSNLLILMGCDRSLGRRTGRLMPALFGVSPNGAAALFLGCVGGFPVGAMTIARLYSRGSITRDDACRLSAFCCNAGPAFLLGAAGAHLLGSATAGALLLAVHLLAAVLTGMLLSGGSAPVRREAPSPPQPPLPFSAAFPQAVSQGCTGMVQLCGFVVFFSVILALAGRLPAGDNLLRLLAGVLEVSCGIESLQGLADFPAFVSAAAVLGWSGLCVHCQTAFVLQGCGLKLRSYLRGKLLHTALSVLLAVPAALLWGVLSHRPALPTVKQALLAPALAAVAGLLLLFSKRGVEKPDTI